MGDIMKLMEFIKKNSESYYAKLLFDEKSIELSTPLIHPVIYNRYLGEYQRYLFDKLSIDEIINLSKTNQLARNFIALYIIKDKTTFYKYYGQREKLQLEMLFDNVLNSLFNEDQLTEEGKVVTSFRRNRIEMLELDSEMISTVSYNSFASEINTGWYNYFLFVYELRENKGK